MRDITYDVADLYNFIDGLADMSALVWGFRTMLKYISKPELNTVDFLITNPFSYVQLWSLDPSILALRQTVD